MIALLSTLLLFQIAAPVLENDYLTVHRNVAPCAQSELRCGDRVIVALGTISLDGLEMHRGDIRVFRTDEDYSQPLAGEFVEVVLKLDRPPVRTTAATIVPENYNTLLYEGPRFRVIEGRLRPGDRRERHTHNQRLIISINSTRLREQVEGQPEGFADLIADNIGFSEPTTHAIENVGSVPVRNIVIELKPD